MHLLLIAIALLLSLRAPARGDDSLSLAEVIAAALSHNPALQAARARVDAARAVPAQVAAYADPKLSYEAFNVPNSLRLDRAENNIFQVSQAIPFPGKRGLAGTVAKHDAEAMASGLRSLELDTVAMVKRAYYDLWLADARRQLYERDRVLGQRLTRLAEQRYATAEVSQADVLQAQVELSRLINRTMTARLAIASAAAELNAMLSRPPNQALDLPEIPDIPPIEQPLAHWVELALQQRPELEAQRALLARESSNVELARKQYYPDFEVTAGRLINTDMRDGFGAMVSVSLPFAYLSKYDAGVDQAKARLTAAHADQRGLQDRIRREVSQALLRVQTARLQRDLFVDTHLPQSEQALRVTESAYQAGVVDFLALTQAARRIEEIHVEHLDAETDLAKAYADLERAVGVVSLQEQPR